MIQAQPARPPSGLLAAAEAVGQGAAPSQGAAPPERVLADATERMMRSPQGKLAVVLHMSQMAPAGPRPHHVRVARGVLQDCAQRSAGQVFALRNSDLVLLCTAARDRPQAEAGRSPEGLKRFVEELFAAEMRDPSRLVSAWRLDQEAASFQAYLTARAADARQAAAQTDDLPTTSQGLADFEQIAMQLPIAGFMVQQTGVSVSTDRRLDFAARLAPCFRALRISMAPLKLPVSVTEALADPFMVRHLTISLEMRLLRRMHDDLYTLSRRGRSDPAGRIPVHINISPKTIFSPAFARVARLARAVGQRIGVEISLLQACADIGVLEHVRTLLDLAEMELILGPIDKSTLTLSRDFLPAPHWVKLLWSPGLADITADPRGHAATILAGIGVDRVVLEGVDSEQAMAWGQSFGVTRFQGPFLAHVQAAKRMSVCGDASGCTLKQCAARCASQSKAGRAGCTQAALLDPSILTLQ